MKYVVHLNAHGSVSVEIEANCPTEAYEKAIEEVSLSDVTASDWNYEEIGEIQDENGKYFSINDLLDDGELS